MPSGSPGVRTHASDRSRKVGGTGEEEQTEVCGSVWTTQSRETVPVMLCSAFLNGQVKLLTLKPRAVVFQDSQPPRPHSHRRLTGLRLVLLAEIAG